MHEHAVGDSILPSHTMMVMVVVEGMDRPSFPSCRARVYDMEGVEEAVHNHQAHRPHHLESTRHAGGGVGMDSILPRMSYPRMVVIVHAMPYIPSRGVHPVLVMVCVLTMALYILHSMLMVCTEDDGGVYYLTSSTDGSWAWRW